MLISLILSVAAAVAPAPKAVLTPRGPWQVHAEDSFCMLLRHFGSDTDGIDVSFQPSIGDGSLTLMIASPAKGGSQETGVAKITRQPDGREFSGRFYSVTIGKQRLTQIWLSGEVFDALDRTASLRVKAQRVNANIEIGRFEKAKTVFRQCEDSLLGSWGIRPATVRDGTRPRAKDYVPDYFRPHDYPSAALSGRYIGHVRAALVVGADGVVKDCRVVTRIGDAFDKITCERARKIPFSPGLDEKGQPAQSLYQLSVRWSLG